MDFPFQQFVGLLVFAIVIGAQIWGSIREGAERRRKAEQAQRERASQGGGPTPAQESEEIDLSSLLEALGIPKPEETEPAPPVPQTRPSYQTKPVASPRKTPTHEPQPAAQPVTPAPTAYQGVGSVEAEMEALMRKHEGTLQRSARARASVKVGPRQPSLSMQKIGLTSPSAMRKAILMREILGPPKGLEQF